MVKKEVLAMKKMFKAPEDTSCRTIAACYVDAEKNPILKLKQSFHSLPEEEAHKYLDLLAKGLYGSFGKSLYNVDCATADGPGKENWELTERLRKSDLEDDGLLEEFYDGIIENCEDMAGNYLIIIAHGYYDIPASGRKMDIDAYDGSDNVYEYLMILRCPVSLSQPGLAVNCSEGRVEDRIRDWVVNMPSDALLYPAFHDRQEDIHHALYYSKTDFSNSFINQIIGNAGGLSGKAEKEWFVNSLGTATNDEPLPLPAVIELQENVIALGEKEKENEQLKVDQKNMDQLLAESGFPEKIREGVANAFEIFDDEKAEVSMRNIMDTSHTEYKGEGFTIRADVDIAPEIIPQKINGRLYLTIPLSNNKIQVNGLQTIAEEK